MRSSLTISSSRTLLFIAKFASMKNIGANLEVKFGSSVKKPSEVMF